MNRLQSTCCTGFKMVVVCIVLAQAAVLPTAPGTPASDVAAQGQTLLVATAPGATTTPSYAPLVTATTLQVSVHHPPFHILTPALTLSSYLHLLSLSVLWF
jgi:hypothetical protein